MSRRSLIGALVLFLVSGSTPVAAHAILVESKPAASGAVEAGPVELRLRYNSRIDKGRSQLTLIRSDRTSRVVPISEAEGSDVLAATVTLTPGSYTLRWQVLAIDGHITRGDLPFTVRAKAGQ